MKIQRYVYLYQGTTVVLNKEDIKNAKDEDFQRLSMFLDINELASILKKYYPMGNKETKKVTKEIIENGGI